MVPGGKLRSSWRRSPRFDLHVPEDGLDHQIGVLHQIAVDVIGKRRCGEAAAQLLLGDDALVQKSLGVGAMPASTSVGYRSYMPTWKLGLDANT